jgi:hypothetical protein
VSDTTIQRLCTSCGENKTLESIIEPALTRSYVAGVGRSGGTWIGTERLSKEVAEQIRAHLATPPQTITPEQAVSVLVEGGAKLEQVTYRATVGTTHMTAGTRILILPIATPEGGK